jgi:hypothetical protein
MILSSVWAKNVATVLTIAISSTTLMPMGIAYAADTTATTPAKPITAPCSLVVYKSGEGSAVASSTYSIVYSVRIGADSKIPPRLRCLGAKSPAEVKDGKVACIVYSCNAEGERCQKVNGAVSGSDLRNAVLTSSNKSKEYVGGEDSIRGSLEQVTGQCPYTTLANLSTDEQQKLNQSLPVLGPTYGTTGSLYGSDVLGGAFGNTGDTQPASSRGGQVPGAKPSATLSPVTLPNGTLVSLQKELGDPNTVVAFQNTPGSEFYPTKSETLFASLDQPSDTPTPPTETEGEKIAKSVMVGTGLILTGSVVTGMGISAAVAAVGAVATGAFVGPVIIILSGAAAISAGAVILYPRVKELLGKGG